MALALSFFFILAINIALQIYDCGKDPADIVGSFVCLQIGVDHLTQTEAADPCVVSFPSLGDDFNSPGCGNCVLSKRAGFSERDFRSCRSLDATDIPLPQSL